MKKKSSNKFNLEDAFLCLQREISQELNTNRVHVKHPSSKGDGTEFKWIGTLKNYLPKRYSADKAFVIDSKGNVSEQLDLVIYDRQYSPFFFHRETSLYIPAESVYAVLEIKQNLNKKHLKYAVKKANSVRRLHRTSASIPFVEGKYNSKPLHKIIAGVLTLVSDWNPPFGGPFKSVIKTLTTNEQIDIGCVLDAGAFEISYNSQKYPEYKIVTKEKALIFFFLKLLAKLQTIGTCPAIEIETYMKHIF